MVCFALATAPAMAQAPKPMMESGMKAAGGRKIPGDELRTLIIGNTVYVLILKQYGNTPPGTVTPAFYKDDKVRVQKLSDGRKLESNWWMEGDNICVEQRSQASQHQCWSGWDLPDTRYFCLQPAGDCFVAVRYAPGNAENL
jgi:hypothetical protein